LHGVFLFVLSVCLDYEICTGITADAGTADACTVLACQANAFTDCSGVLGSVDVDYRGGGRRNCCAKSCCHFISPSKKPE